MIKTKNFIGVKKKKIPDHFLINKKKLDYLILIIMHQILQKSI